MRQDQDGENLLPRERMLNAVRAEEVPSEALLAILLKTGELPNNRVVDWHSARKW